MQLKIQQYEQEILMCWGMHEAQKTEIKRLQREQLRLACEVGKLRSFVAEISQCSGVMLNGNHISDRALKLLAPNVKVRG